MYSESQIIVAIKQSQKGRRGPELFYNMNENVQQV